MSGHDQISLVPPNNSGSVNQNPSPAPPKGYPRSRKSQKEEREGWYKDMRGFVMVVAVLVVSVTYSGGLSPPGGFWQDDLIVNHTAGVIRNHTAGHPVLLDKVPRRYQIFFYANATAFMASLIIIILLMNQEFYCDKFKVAILYMNMMLGLISLMIAYAAGCTRSSSTSIYVIVLAGVVLLIVVLSAEFISEIYKTARDADDLNSN